MNKDLTRLPALSISKARGQLAEICNMVGYGRERIILTRRGKPIAVLIGIEDFKHYQKLQDEHAGRLLESAIATSSGTVPAIEMLD